MAATATGTTTTVEERVVASEAVVLAASFTFSRIAAATFFIASARLWRMGETALTSGFGNGVGGLKEIIVSSTLRDPKLDLLPGHVERVFCPTPFL